MEIVIVQDHLDGGYNSDQESCAANAGTEVVRGNELRTMKDKHSHTLKNAWGELRVHVAHTNY